MAQLAGRVAVVTGASRGAGRAIALTLAEAGATVYATGRSTPGKATTDQRAETIDETARQATARGGTGIAAPCDHTNDAEVSTLFERVRQEQGRLDLLVNNAWGGYEGYDDTFVAPFWEQPLTRWDRMLTVGVRSHLVAAYYAAPLMVSQSRGLIINTTAWDRDLYLGSVFYDVAKAAINRMAIGMARDLHPHGVAVVTLAPGFMRTERVLEAFNADEQNWQTVTELHHTESPFYIGRAVAALAADPDILRQSGHLLTVGELAQTYSFTDIDGRQPPPFRIDA
jgi:NAD(P)-dependent dehydrogenase (short-subunit alcohol dehydrogenase family)